MLGFFCAKLLSFSELPFWLGSLAFNVSAEIKCMGFCIRSEERSGNSSYFTHLWLVGRKEIGASASLKLFGAERLKKVTDAIAARRLHRTQCCVEQDP